MENVSGISQEQADSHGAEQKVAAYSRQEVIDLLQKNLNWFACFLLPSIITILFPPLHFVLWDILKKAVHESQLASPTPKQKYPQIAIGWPRGFAKTTLVKLFICYCIFFSKTKFILIVAANLKKAENILADVWNMLGENNVRSVFGNHLNNVEVDRQELKKFSFMGRDIILAALGAEGDPRGLNLNNERPDLIVMDDMQSKENAESDVQSKSLLSWMTATLMKTKSPHRCCFIYIGNKFSAKGTILKILQKNPNWLTAIFAGILADGSSLWPEFRSTEDLMEEFRGDIAMGTPEAFVAEVMNDDTSAITSVFDISKVPVCPIFEDALVIGSFILIDVAGHKNTANKTAIMRYNFYGNCTVLEEIDAGIFTPGDCIRRTLQACLKYNIPAVGCETVAYQASLLWWFQEICRQVGVEGIQFVELHPKGVTKNARIMAMFRTLVGSKTDDMKTEPTLYLREQTKPEFFWEITQFKPAKTDNADDIIDNASYVEQMIQDHGMHILNNIPTEWNREFHEAKVLDFNSAF